jgi:hypothetical protein
MTFRVKDLLINVVPQEERDDLDGGCALSCPPGTVLCKGGSPGPGLFNTTWCDAHTIIGPIPLGQRDDAAGAQLLEKLKQQLRKALADLEHPENIANEDFKSLREIEDLQDKLREAIVELDGEKSKFGSTA